LEDVAHDAAYAVLERLSEFRGDSTLLNFARRFAVLTAMNARRRDMAQKRARLRDAIEPDAIVSDALDPEQRVSTDSFLPVVRELLDSLPEPLAEAFALQVILGYSVEEIAELTGAPHETVRSRLRLAKQALRQRALAHPVLRQAAEGLHDR
jgi:RNA polymerase sigma-70 factor (ECF subfamily)